MKAKLLHFPSARAVARSSAPAEDVVRIRIVDQRRPKMTRWYAQFGVQRAGGFTALAGFTDALARSGNWHRFQIEPRFVARFLRDVDDLLSAGRIEVRLNGAMVRPAGVRRSA